MRKILSHCLEAAPNETGKRIKFAGFGQSLFRSREVGEALATLQKAMLLHLVYPVTKPELPLYPNKKKHPRLQFVDIGLLNYFGNIQDHYFSLQDMNTLEKGRLAEQVVGQELLAQAGHKAEKPVMWIREKRPSSAEVDFVTAWRGKLIPIEVKSSAVGHLKSLHQYMDEVSHNLAVRLYAGNIHIDDCVSVNGKPFKLLNLPYFLASKIQDYLHWAFTTSTPAYLS
jgi:predicted AAA+ superfamily ATPase